MKHETSMTRFRQLIRWVFSELDDSECCWKVSDDAERDKVLVSKSTGQSYCLDVKIRERITPQMAEDLFRRFRQEPLPEHGVRIAYAPVISPRVAEIARRHDISFMDYAGNCRIVDRATGLLISRSGIPNEASKSRPKTTDLFAPKSSRIVRAMLHEPRRGWQVSELAEHPDVDVSKGLVSRVTQALTRESYAAVHNRLVYLTQPLALLTAWTGKYPGPAGRRKFYMRGSAADAERVISSWCEASGMVCALAEFSAAWKHAPVVRYSVASLYVAPGALDAPRLESLHRSCGAKEVESGANLMLLTPFDRSVFVQRVSDPEPTTSPLQTFLDLQSMAGRGSDAAEAVFEKHLREMFESTHTGEGA